MYLLKAVSNILTNIGNLNDTIRKYIVNMDGWIKEINTRISKVEDTYSLVNENIDDIQHNYELIFELKDQIEEMKQEVNALKLIQIISLKKERNLVKERLESK